MEKKVTLLSVRTVPRLIVCRRQPAARPLWCLSPARSRIDRSEAALHRPSLDTL
jgi:hypothetical protein